MEITFSPEDWLAPTEVLLNDVPCDLDVDLPILDVASAFNAPTLCALMRAGLLGRSCGRQL